MNAIEIERELTEDEFEEALDDIYGDVEIAGHKYSTGQTLREIDPIAFRCGLADYGDSLETEEWVCGECESVYDNEDDAEECCQEDVGNLDDSIYEELGNG